MVCSKKQTGFTKRILLLKLATLTTNIAIQAYLKTLCRSIKDSTNPRNAFRETLVHPALHFIPQTIPNATHTSRVFVRKRCALGTPQPSPDQVDGVL
jgi:hypothetical protein